MTRVKTSLEQPGKKETLAIKRKLKIRQANHSRSRWPGISSQRWVGTGEAVAVFFLFLANLFWLYPFFGQEDRANAFSAPLLPVLAGAVEKWIPFAYGVRLWLVIFMIFFPLSFYYFAREISGRRLIALLATLIATLPAGIFLLARVNLGLFSQDGSHMASLTLTPLFCLLLLRFLRRGHFWAGVLTAVGTALVAMVSPVGFLVLIIFMTMITFSEILLGQGRVKAMRFLVMMVLALGFSAFWYNPSFTFQILGSSRGQIIIKTFTTLLPVSFFTVPLLAIIGFLLFENRPQLQPLFIAFFLTAVFGLFSLGAGVAHPEPSRFIPAFGISLAFLLGISIVKVSDFIRLSPKIKRFKPLWPYRQLVGFGLIGLVLLVTGLVGVVSGKNLWDLSEAQVLGLASNQKVGVWQVKEGISQAQNLAGYVISLITGVLVFILKFKFL